MEQSLGMTTDRTSSGGAFLPSTLNGIHQKANCQFGGCHFLCAVSDAFLDSGSSVPRVVILLRIQRNDAFFCLVISLASFLLSNPARLWTVAGNREAVDWESPSFRLEQVFTFPSFSSLDLSYCLIVALPFSIQNALLWRDSPIRMTVWKLMIQCWKLSVLQDLTKNGRS